MKAADWTTACCLLIIMTLTLHYSTIPPYLSRPLLPSLQTSLPTCMSLLHSPQTFIHSCLFSLLPTLYTPLPLPILLFVSFLHASNAKVFKDFLSEASTLLFSVSFPLPLPLPPLTSFGLATFVRLVLSLLKRCICSYKAFISC